MNTVPPKSEEQGVYSSATVATLSTDSIIPRRALLFLVPLLALTFWIGVLLLTWSRPMTLLVLGADNRTQDEPSRSDSILVVHVDPRHGLVRGLALPRDLYLPLRGLPVRRTERINAALFYGDYYAGDLGMRAARDTVSTAIGVPIDATIIVHFELLKHLVNALGGIEVYCEKQLVDEKFNHLDQPFSYKLVFPAGWNRLDGTRATEFARLRRPDTDFGRMSRNQKLMAAVVARLRTPQGLLRLPLVLPRLPRNVETDMGYAGMARATWLLSRYSGRGIAWDTIKKNDVLPYITAKGSQVLIPEPGILKQAGRILTGEQPVHMASAGSTRIAQP